MKKIVMMLYVVAIILTCLTSLTSPSSAKEENGYYVDVMPVVQNWFDIISSGGSGGEGSRGEAPDLKTAYSFKSNNYRLNHSYNSFKDECCFYC